MLDLNKPSVQWLFLFFLALTWGSSFILMKKGLLSYSHDQVASLRIIISFIFLSPVILRNFRKIKRNQWGKLFIAGLLGSGLPAFLFPLAQTQISSSLTGMLNSLVPLFTVLLGITFFNMPVRWKKIIGVLIGLAGAIGLVISTGSSAGESKNIWYAGFVVLATICYATNVNFIKNQLKEINSIDITSFGFLFIGPAAGVYLFTTDFTTVLSSVEKAPLHLLYIAVLAIFGTAIAVILFNMLIKRVSAVFASSVTYIIPVFAIFWGFLDGEKIGLLQLLFIGIILIGVYIVNRDNRLERKEEQKLQEIKKVNQAVA